MAAKRSNVDLFSQLGYMQVVESAATTLTFAGMDVFSNLLEPRALVIHQIEYNVDEAELMLLVNNDDAIIFGLAGDDSMNTVALNDPQVYDYNKVLGQLRGTAANLFIEHSPIIKDFTKLPGGGVLVPADRIYLYVNGIGVTTAVTIECRFRFTARVLTPAEYLELAQTLRVLT